MKLNVLNNTRDLGGIASADGRTIRPGRLIRSGHLYSADAADIAVLTEKVGIVVDFRTTEETKEKPDPVLPGAERVFLPILTERNGGITHEEKTDRESERNFFRDPDAAMRRMCGMYRMIGGSEWCAGQYEKFVRILLEPNEKAVLWHCTAGKDRAGIAAVIIEELLGVPRSTVYEDYLLTNKYLQEEVDELIGRLGKMMDLSDPAAERAVRILFGADQAFLDAFYEQLDNTWGGTESYLKNGLHISGTERDRLKEMYLQ